MLSIQAYFVQTLKTFPLLLYSSKLVHVMATHLLTLDAVVPIARLARPIWSLFAANKFRSLTFPPPPPQSPPLPPSALVRTEISMTSRLTILGAVHRRARECSTRPTHHTQVYSTLPKHATLKKKISKKLWPLRWWYGRRGVYVHRTWWVFSACPPCDARSDALTGGARRLLGEWVRERDTKCAQFGAGAGNW